MAAQMRRLNDNDTGYPLFRTRTRKATMIRFNALIPLALAGWLVSQPAGANDLPEIGTAGVSALTVEQEIQYGDAYMRMMRATHPILRDPVLNEYIDSLGYTLVANADSVRVPFRFFLIRDDEINAAAFLGGNVGINTGLFLYADNESELAAVLAHEITHVTQRHLARSMEAQARSNPATLAALVGSVMLAIVNPAAGMAAMQSTLALNQQSAINYTRSNEQEADRLSMQILVRSGFDPHAIPDFFGKLAEKYRYTSKPPPMLLTHPLPDTRIADSRSRAAQYPQVQREPSLEYQLAKARIQVRFGIFTPEQALDYFQRLEQRSSLPLKQQVARYGQALALFEQGNIEQAAARMQTLLEMAPENLFYVDTQTDIDLRTGQTQRAIERLLALNKLLPDNSVITLNLAHAYLDTKQYGQAARVLDLFVRKYSDSILAWSMLADAYQATGRSAEYHIAQAEYHALTAAYKQAINELDLALQQSTDRLQRARIEARRSQLRQQQAQLEEMG